MSSEAYSRIWLFFKILWICSVSLCGVYLTIVYLLPLIITYHPIIPGKFIIELLVCAIPIVTGSILTFNRIKHIEISISAEQEFLIVCSDNRVAATCCLELSSAPSSIITSSDEQSKYDVSMLLAIRGGMSKLVNMAYEVGVSDGEPFLRVFISAIGHSKSDVCEILRREATRTEAILLASLTGVELKQLKDDTLQEAASSMVEFDVFDTLAVDSDKENYQEKSLVIIKGTPRVAPTVHTSQIGTFIETLLRKGYSASLTCVFSPTKSGRERRKLEGKWRNIREKERRNEDSLKGSINED